MPYTVPTLDQFVEVYEEFSEINEAKINRALAAAARKVDDTWLEDDYQPAIMALAAHVLTALAAASDAFGQDDLRAISIGPLSLTYGDKITIEDLASTSYGQEYAELLKLNHPPILAI